MLVTITGSVLPGEKLTCSNMIQLNPGTGSAVQTLTLAPVDYFQDWASLLDQCVMNPRVEFEKLSVSTELATCRDSIARMVQNLKKIEFCVSRNDKPAASDWIHALEYLEAVYYKAVSCLVVKNSSELNQSLREFISNTKAFLSRVNEVADSVENMVSKYYMKSQLLKALLEDGVEYCGAESCLLDVLQHENINYFVLFIKETFDPREVLEAINGLLEKMQRRKADRRYVLLDLDVYRGEDLEFEVPERAVIGHYKGRWLSTDVQADSLCSGKANLVLFNALSGSAQGKVGHLTMRCPGSYGGTCPAVKVPWTCAFCSTLIEYGLDTGRLYCDCGWVEVADALFQCCHYGHEEPIAFSHPLELKTQLQGVKPLQEVNLLLIGQSGVGKSTWINSIVNYLSFDTLDAAVTSPDLVWLVPTQFTLYDADNVAGVQVKIGEDANENDDVGASATQACKTYNIVAPGRLVRLIDTPGLGDTRGYEQDCTNVGLILSHLKNIEKIHGICFLLKPNEPRKNASFMYCVKELFCYLDKSAQENIVFCFTNVRSTEYKPGSSFSLLKHVLNDAECNLTLGQNNIYCLDNESYRFLCAIRKTSIEFPEMDRKSYSDSWDRSVTETKRLFENISRLQPHKVETSLNIASLRHKMSMVTDSLRDAAAVTGSSAISKYHADIKVYEDKITLLKKDLYVTKPVIEKKTLTSRKGRVVCSRPSCTEVFDKNVYYKTECCKSCDASETYDVLVNEELLARCESFRGGKCVVCRCSWQHHMIVNYAQTKTEKHAVDPSVNSKIEDTYKLIREVRSKLAAERQKAMFGKNHELRLMAFGVKLSSYMKENAMILYNDDLKNYLAYLVASEDAKPDKTAEDRANVKKLMALKLKCEDEDRIVEEMKVGFQGLKRASLYNDDLKNYLAYLVASEDAKPDKTAEDRANVKKLMALKLKCEDEDRIVEEMKVGFQGLKRASLVDICNEEMELRHLACYKQKPCAFDQSGPNVNTTVRLKSQGVDFTAAGGSHK